MTTQARRNIRLDLKDPLARGLSMAFCDWRGSPSVRSVGSVGDIFTIWATYGGSTPSPFGSITGWSGTSSKSSKYYGFGYGGTYAYYGFVNIAPGYSQWPIDSYSNGRLGFAVGLSHPSSGSSMVHHRPTPTTRSYGAYFTLPSTIPTDLPGMSVFVGRGNSLRADYYWRGADGQRAYATGVASGAAATAVTQGSITVGGSQVGYSSPTQSMGVLWNRELSRGEIERVLCLSLPFAASAHIINTTPKGIITAGSHPYYYRNFVSGRST